ncbi:MazG-like family protein [Streptomyces sp. ODS28]|uniref:MazG-like family protein n=1 Tax=Streptomyces sp. ODS28 TaxID=3136688 RepID=UPI0031E9D781
MTTNLAPAVDRDETLWHHIGTLAGWLDKHNGTDAHQTAMLLLKLSEESGEVAQAYLGWRGQNPRKGTTNGPEQVATELCDVVITALVALHHFTPDPPRFLAEVIQHRAERLARILHSEHHSEELNT